MRFKYFKSIFFLFYYVSILLFSRAFACLENQLLASDGVSCVESCNFGEIEELQFKFCIPCRFPTPFASEDHKKCLEQCPAGSRINLRNSCESCSTPMSTVSSNGLSCVLNCSIGEKIVNQQCFPYLLDNKRTKTSENLDINLKSLQFEQAINGNSFSNKCTDACQDDNDGGCLEACQNELKLVQESRILLNCPSSAPFMNLEVTACVSVCPSESVIASNGLQCVKQCELGEAAILQQNYMHQCVRCVNPSPFVSFDRRECLEQCGTGQIQKGNQCEACTFPKLYLNSNRTACVDSCDLGEAMVGEICVPCMHTTSFVSVNRKYCVHACDENKNEFAIGQMCVKCGGENPPIRSFDGQGCVNACESGEIVNEKLNRCERCPENARFSKRISNTCVVKCAFPEIENMSGNECLDDGYKCSNQQDFVTRGETAWKCVETCEYSISTSLSLETQNYQQMCVEDCREIMEIYVVEDSDNNNRINRCKLCNESENEVFIINFNNQIENSVSGEKDNSLGSEEGECKNESQVIIEELKNTFDWILSKNRGIYALSLFKRITKYLHKMTEKVSIGMKMRFSMQIEEANVDSDKFNSYSFVWMTEVILTSVIALIQRSNQLAISKEFFVFQSSDRSIITVVQQQLHGFRFKRTFEYLELFGNEIGGDYLSMLEMEVGTQSRGDSYSGQEPILGLSLIAWNPLCGQNYQCEGESKMVVVTTSEMIGRKKYKRYLNSLNGEFEMRFYVGDTARKIQQYVCLELDFKKMRRDSNQKLMFVPIVMASIVSDDKRKITCSFNSNVQLFYDAACQFVSKEYCEVHRFDREEVSKGQVFKNDISENDGSRERMNSVYFVLVVVVLLMLVMILVIVLVVQWQNALKSGQHAYENEKVRKYGIIAGMSKKKRRMSQNESSYALNE